MANNVKAETATGREPLNIVFLFLFSCFSALSGGFSSFINSLRWFPIAEMLRSFVPEGIIFALLLLLPAKLAAFAIILLFLPNLMLAFSNVLHIAIYKSPISTFAVQSSLETSYNEATEFLTEFVTLPNALIALLLVLIYFYISRRAFRAALQVKRSCKLRLAASIILAAFCLIIAHKGDRLLRSDTAVVTVRALLSHQEDMAKINSLLHERKQLHFEDVHFIGSPADDILYVVVVGESMNRHHMSLYGYHRQTTPQLDALAASEVITVFKDTVSASTHTIPSLRSTLLLQNFDAGAAAPDDNATGAKNNAAVQKNPLAAHSLIGLFKDAGFKTYWFSNQTANADGLTGTAVIASDADVTLFFNRARHEGSSISYDEVLLPELEKIAKQTSGKRVVFLHLIGSHLSYGLRYPGAFQYFTDVADIPDASWRPKEKKRYVNEYDNSVRYTDHILERVIGTVSASAGSNLVIYFSDHGQEVYDTLPIRGQDARNPSRNMYDVPFIVWLSDDFKQGNAAFVKQMEAAANTPFTLANFTQSAADLARIRFKGFNPAQSLFQPQYESMPRHMPIGGAYDDLPLLKPAR